MLVPVYLTIVNCSEVIIFILFNNGLKYLLILKFAAVLGYQRLLATIYGVDRVVYTEMPIITVHSIKHHPVTRRSVICC